MSARFQNLNEDEVSPAAVDWINEFGNHFGTYRRVVLPLLDEVAEEYRAEKLAQFDLILPDAQVGLVPEERIKPVFPKTSFLGSWKSFDKEIDQKRQLLGGLFHSEKNEMMEDAFLLHEAYGISRWTLQLNLRWANLLNRGRVFTSGDYDNFNRDLRLLQQGKDLGREGLHLEPRFPAVDEQVKKDEAQSLRKWAASYQFSRGAREASNAPLADKQAHLKALWIRTAQLQENNDIPLERFENELRRAKASPGQIDALRNGVAEAKEEIATRPFAFVCGEIRSTHTFEMVRGPVYTLDILESAPAMRLYPGAPKEIPEDLLPQRER